VQPPALNQPVDLLSAWMDHPGPFARLLLLNGQSGSGKTHFCLALVDAARSKGLEVAGLVSPAVFSAAGKIGIDLLDIKTGRQRNLARRRQSTGKWLAVGDWELDPRVLAWGNRLLGSAGACDLLILDEMGPLEFTAGSGLTNAFALIEARRYRLACVGIRPALLPDALARWPWAQSYALPARQEAA